MSTGASAKGNAEIILCIIHALLYNHCKFVIPILMISLVLIQQRHVHIYLEYTIEFCSAALYVFWREIILASFITRLMYKM